MIIYSEITGEEYETVDECLGAEHKYLKDQEEAKKAEEEHQKLLDEAYEAAIKACEKYLNLAGVSLEIEEEDEEDEEDEYDLDEWLINELAELLGL